MNTISTLEILPDEMILHICQYLRSTDVLYSFFNLNTRFNRTIIDFCHSLNLNCVTHKQFDYIWSNILSQIRSNIQSVVMNGYWTSFLTSKVNPIQFEPNISLVFPNLRTLTLEYFNGAQLLTFLDKINGLSQLIKLDIKCLMDRRFDELLGEVLAANNSRLKFVTFDHESIFLPFPTMDERTLYPNIQELTVNLIDCDMLGDLFTSVPNVRRLYIKLGIAPSVSTASLENVSPLIHLNNFQLRSIDMVWEFEDIFNILCKMPSLQILSLYLCTMDKRIIDRQNLDVILPSSLRQLNLFILYQFLETDIEFDTLLSTWPSDHISASRFYVDSNQCAIINTVPFNLNSLVIPSILCQHMLSTCKHMQKVENLIIHKCSSYIDVLMIVQHFHRLRTLNLRLQTGAQSSHVTQSIQPIVLHLPLLKRLQIIGSCEVFHLLAGTPNLDDLSIDFNCYNNIINDESICKLLQKRIVRLEIFGLQVTQRIRLDAIIQKFTNLRCMIVTVNDPSFLIDTLVLEALEMWREEELILLSIEGYLSQNGSKILREWFNDHSCLQEKDSFALDYYRKVVHLWL